VIPIKKLTYALSMILIVLIDLFTKEKAKEYFQGISTLDFSYPYGGIGIFQQAFGGIDFSLGYVENYGAAFGLFSQFPQALLMMRIIVIASIFFWFFFMPKKRSYSFEIIFILGGAIGNIIDMLRQQYVIDFINIHLYGYPFPLFNVADSFITIGAFILIIKEIFYAKKEKKNLPSPD
jgi:signal peptidase II